MRSGYCEWVVEQAVNILLHEMSESKLEWDVNAYKTLNLHNMPISSVITCLAHSCHTH